MNLRIGTAAWTIPSEFRSHFPAEGSQLQSYSQVFNSVEINSSFNKIHMPGTYAKWATLTPDEFAFSIKLHRNFTHNCDLKPSKKELKDNLAAINELGDKWKVLLLQFPSKQMFDAGKMSRFYELIRKSYAGAIVVEPRNLSWLEKESRMLMKEFKVSKVVADPERCPTDVKTLLTAGGVTYFRLHGSPEIYRSSYTDKYLKGLSLKLAEFKHAWCIFDNTTFGAATGNALKLRQLSLR